ncbi:MAG: membrane protein insertion efficiency factor YidD, partial [Candidatus Lindowbacteria bacterium]|nr:membrane protein insertion efficiency factor YidD [Candidatus Lindowbacteria bacterium]
MKNIFISIIKIYQFFSKFTAPRCRFIPPCSTYAIEAVKKYGSLKGIYL